MREEIRQAHAKSEKKLDRTGEKAKGRSTTGGATSRKKGDVRIGGDATTGGRGGAWENLEEKMS